MTSKKHDPHAEALHSKLRPIVEDKLYKWEDLGVNPKIQRGPNDGSNEVNWKIEFTPSLGDIETMEFRTMMEDGKIVAKIVKR